MATKTKTATTTSSAAPAEIETSPLCGFDNFIILHKLHPKYSVRGEKVDQVQEMMYLQQAGPFQPCMEDTVTESRGVCRAYGSAAPATCEYVAILKEDRFFSPMCIPVDLNTSEKLKEVGLHSIGQDEFDMLLMEWRGFDEDQYVRPEPRRASSKERGGSSSTKAHSLILI